MDAGPETKDAGLFFGAALLPGGWARDVRITLSGGCIAAIDTSAMPAADDARFGCVLPGMPNLHSHAFQRGMAGLAERRSHSDDSFWTWREVMYRFVERLSADDLRIVATLAFSEMLESGFTRVGEFHYLHHDRDGGSFADPAEMGAAIVEAAEASGIALTLLPVFYAHAGFGGADPQPGQRRFVTDIDDYARLLAASDAAAASLGDAVVGVAPHSLRAVTPGEFAALASLGDRRPFHIHVAEQALEVEQCVAWSGARPVEWLLANAAVDERWCLVHATHMTEAETAALAASKAVAGLCPVTEANLGDGLFPATAYAAAGGRFGIGSDSNILIDAAEELRLLEYGQRLAFRRRNLMASGAEGSSGGALFREALEGGAAALGASTGLAVGLAADMVALDTDHPSLSGKTGDALLDGWIFAAGRAAIDTVWRRGRPVVRAGRHVDRDRIRAAYRAVLARILE